MYFSRSGRPEPYLTEKGEIGVGTGKKWKEEMGERGGRGKRGKGGKGRGGRGKGEKGEREERGKGERGKGKGEKGERGKGERGKGKRGERGEGERGKGEKGTSPATKGTPSAWTRPPRRHLRNLRLVLVDLIPWEARDGPRRHRFGGSSAIPLRFQSQPQNQKTRTTGKLRYDLKKPSASL